MDIDKITTGIDESAPESCTYDDCKKNLDLAFVRSDEQHIFNVTPQLRDHYNRHHNDSNPVDLIYEINNVNRKFLIYRGSKDAREFSCLCGRLIQDRNSVRRHFKNCAHLSFLAPLLALDPDPIIFPYQSIPPPPEIPKTNKGKQNKQYLDFMTFSLRKVACELLDQREKTKEQVNRMLHLEEKITRLSDQLHQQEKIKSDMHDKIESLE
ncbi:hypothetical protein BX616_005623, partial [Lobosporangium transversale]